MGEIHLQEKDGFYYFSCGAVLNEDGERKYKKHTLGKDYKLAMRKAEALSLAWDAETTVDPQTGLKVWSLSSVEAALRFAIEAATPSQSVEAPQLEIVPYVASACLCSRLAGVAGHPKVESGSMRRCPRDPRNSLGRMTIAPQESILWAVEIARTSADQARQTDTEASTDWIRCH